MIEDKIEMQENFIKNLDESGKERIQKKKDSIKFIENEIDELNTDNEGISMMIEKELQPKLEELTSTNSTLKKLNSIKAKLEQKIQTLVSEHKFFQENTVCPTCTQSIENEFRLNKIVDIEEKSKELNDGYRELEDAINVEQEKDQQFLSYSTEISKLNNDITTNNVKITGLNKQIRNLGHEIQEITEQIQNRNTERKTLENLIKDLDKIEKDRSNEKEQISYYDFAHSLMKDGGVKSKIIKKYLPLMNQQINKYLQMMDFPLKFEQISEDEFMQAYNEVKSKF